MNKEAALSCFSCQAGIKGNEKDVIMFSTSKSDIKSYCVQLFYQKLQTCKNERSYTKLFQINHTYIHFISDRVFLIRNKK